MQSCDELRVVRIDLAAKKNSGDLRRAREALQSRNIDFGHSLTFAWYPKVDHYSQIRLMVPRWDQPKIEPISGLNHYPTMAY